MTKVIAEMKKAGITIFELGGIDPNPRIDSVRAGGELCKKEKIDAVLAVGGGSVLDGTNQGGARASVLLNAGATIYVAGAAPTLKDGIALAGRSIDSGAALRKLEQLIEASHGTGA